MSYPLTLLPTHSSFDSRTRKHFHNSQPLPQATALATIKLNSPEKNRKVQNSQPDTRGLNEKWRIRFEFFEKHGDPNSKDARENLRLQPRKIRRLITTNWYAFFFAPIYLFVLGLWRKGITLWTLLILIEIFLGAAGINTNNVSRATNIALGAYYMATINYMYFNRRIHGKSGWNPFRMD